MSLYRYSFNALLQLIQWVLYESKINFEVYTYIPFKIMIIMKQSRSIIHDISGMDKQDTDSQN